MRRSSWVTQLYFDPKVLWESTMYVNAQYWTLFNLASTWLIDGTPLYLLGDKGYLLLWWIMTPHRNGDQSILESLYTISIRKEGLLWIMPLEYSNKPSKNLGKTYLHVTIVPNMIACYIIYNLLFAKNEIDIKHMLHILEEEALENNKSLLYYRMVKKVLDVYILGGIDTYQMQFQNSMITTTIVLGQKILGETFHNQLKIYLGNHQRNLRTCTSCLKFSNLNCLAITFNVCNLNCKPKLKMVTTFLWRTIMQFEQL